VGTTWELQFYEDKSGREPVKAWLDGLDESKRAAAMRGLSIILAELGPDVCQSEYGKALGHGLTEFRLRHSAAEVISAHRPELLEKLALPQPDEPAILRVFFHAHADRLILLLGAYDKGSDPSDKRQQTEIALARKRLGEFRRREKAKRIGSQFRLWWMRQVRK
jgi:phage-related protein